MDLETAARHLAPQLLRYCLVQAGDPALAEEAAQDALTALVQRWRRHGAPECPAAFAFAVARRRAFRLRLQRRLTEPLKALFPGFSPLPDPEAQAAGRTDLARTLAALRRLPGRDREALLLVSAGELSLAEGSRILGVSVPALKMRIHRARKRLSQLLEESHATNGSVAALQRVR